MRQTPFESLAMVPNPQAGLRETALAPHASLKTRRVQQTNENRHNLVMMIRTADGTLQGCGFRRQGRMQLRPSKQIRYPFPKELERIPSSHVLICNNTSSTAAYASKGQRQLNLPCSARLQSLFPRQNSYPKIHKISSYYPSSTGCRRFSPPFFTTSRDSDHESVLEMAPSRKDG